ncbi:uncharacterized protein LOC120630605 [Pararge aegeria]|uniref:uncharacterized protein LOC120630605 n=1 Tax=Pararge aegeria TaxID=116150 RepID=UPI0019D2B389|nr:uncharacterized protein LOC120630605 [Pararge aegeria]
MPRVYKPDPRGKRHKKYDENIINEAVAAYANSNFSLKAIAEKYDIDKSVLYRHSVKTMKKQGGQTILTEETEECMIKYINICAEWGCPLDALDLRYIVKAYLDQVGRTVLKFKHNLPGPDFVASFLKRHKNQISQRYSQNIKKKRAEVSPDTIKEYFKELEVSLAGINPSNVINYDETNLTDDPGRKKIITKRGTKYPERVMNSSKSSVSLMIAATADGSLLPPYVVYKAQNLYNTWTENGPLGARYNRTQSGWFDATIFEDWIKSIIIPYFKDKVGKKCLIGDNLSSHLSMETIKLCYEQNISFIFLPANSTHLTQPLDVAFFRPMKIAWRNVVLKWKKTDGKAQATIPKGCFPRLLNKLMEELRNNSKANIIAGFRKTGIYPINEDEVLSRLPKVQNNENKTEIEKSVLDLLKEMRYGTMDITEPKRKKKLEVIPGRSVSNENEDYIEEESQQKTKKRRLTSKIIQNNKENTTTKTYDGKERNKYTGKGVAKKTKSQDQNIAEKENKQENGQDTEKIQLDTINDLDFIANNFIESMPIIMEDMFLCENEIVIHDIQINEMQNDTGVEMTYKQENATENSERKLKILSNKNMSDITTMKTVTLNKCKKINKNSHLKILDDTTDNIDRPGPSSLQSIQTRQPSCYYKNDDDILKDLMSDDI